MEHPEDILKGALYSLFSFFFFALFGVFVKFATFHTTGAWSNFISFVVGTAILFFFLLKHGFGYLKTSHFPFHLGRAAFGVFASFAYVCSVLYIPLLNATLLYNASPLFIPIFAIFMLNCKTNAMTWISIVLGFIGIAFIIHPTLDIVEHPGDLLALVSGISLAIAFVFVKMLTRTEPRMKILYYYFFLATLLQLPFIPLFGSFPPLSSILYSAAAGVALILAQWGLVKSYEHAPASKVGIFQYSAVVFIGIFDWMIWGLKPTLTEMIGTAIVILAGGLILSRGQQQTPRSNP